LETNEEELIWKTAAANQSVFGFSLVLPHQSIHSKWSQHPVLRPFLSATRIIYEQVQSFASKVAAFFRF
jgi:hypothetical protein